MIFLLKKGSLEEAYSIKCFPPCCEYLCGSYRWASFQNAHFATGTRDQWHPLPSVVMLRQKVVQLQLLAFSNLLAEVDNSPIRRAMTGHLGTVPAADLKCWLLSSVRCQNMQFIFILSILLCALSVASWGAVKKEILKVNAETPFPFHSISDLPVLCWRL